jgi:hypothetical protein
MEKQKNTPLPTQSDTKQNKKVIDDLISITYIQQPKKCLHKLRILDLIDYGISLPYKVVLPYLLVGFDRNELKHQTENSQKFHGTFD